MDVKIPTLSRNPREGWGTRQSRSQAPGKPQAVILSEAMDLCNFAESQHCMDPSLRSGWQLV